jgi:hypothetical protein
MHFTLIKFAMLTMLGCLVIVVSYERNFLFAEPEQAKCQNKKHAVVVCTPNNAPLCKLGLISDGVPDLEGCFKQKGSLFAKDRFPRNPPEYQIHPSTIGYNPDGTIVNAECYTVYSCTIIAYPDGTISCEPDIYSIGTTFSAPARPGTKCPPE